MSTTHVLLLYALPFACGAGVAWLASPRLWAWHALAVAAAATLSLVIAYGGFLIAAGLMTGNWPQEITLVGIAYALAWFSIPGVFTIVPTAGVGYLLATLSTGRHLRREPLMLEG